MSSPLKSLGVIGFVQDERVSREKRQILMRILNAMRQRARVEMIDSSISENELLKKMEERDFQLLLLPWYKYLGWSKIEAYNGLTRTTGPTVAGYFADQVLPCEPSEPSSFLRAILLDFTHLSPGEVLLLINSLAQENLRAGIRPWLEKSSTIFCENWYPGHLLGNTLNTMLNLPDLVSSSQWSKRIRAIRIALGALWGLIFEEGPGKSDFAQALTSKMPKAYFQIGISQKTLALRLFYPIKSFTPKDALRQFWPSRWDPTSAAQLLIKHSDLLRVHPVVDTSEIEITALFFLSAPSEIAPGDLKTLWIEPITSKLILEPMFEEPTPEKPYLRTLAGAPLSKASILASAKENPSQLQAKDRFIQESATKIRRLTRELAEKDFFITELRAGGVGSAAPPPPPDAEALLEAFLERCHEADHNIHTLQKDLARLQSKGARGHELDWIQRKIAFIENRKVEWLHKIAAIVKSINQLKRSA